MTQQNEISLKELLNEISWNERKFYRNKQFIEERYKLDLENFKKAPNKLEKVGEDDHYAFPVEIKDLIMNSTFYNPHHSTHFLKILIFL